MWSHCYMPARPSTLPSLQVWTAHKIEHKPRFHQIHFTFKFFKSHLSDTLTWLLVHLHFPGTLISDLATSSLVLFSSKATFLKLCNTSSSALFTASCWQSKLLVVWSITEVFMQLLQLHSGLHFNTTTSASKPFLHEQLVRVGVLQYLFLPNIEIGYAMKLRGLRDLDSCGNLYKHPHTKCKGVDTY